MAKKPHLPLLPDEDLLDEQIRQQKKRAALGMAIMVPSVLFLIVAAFGGSVLGMVLAAVLFGTGWHFRSGARAAIKDTMTRAALLPALKTVFQKVHYDPTGHISPQDIRRANLGFSFDKVTGSDHVQALYQGLPFAFSDIRLISIDESTDDEGTVTETEATEFQGLWMICDFRKPFAADLLLRQRKGPLEIPPRSRIQTGNAAFDKRFFLFSDSGEAVFRILTPSMQDCLLNMSRDPDGLLYLRFRKDGTLHFAIQNGQDLFEVKKFRKASAKALQAQYLSELRYLTDLIDTLRQVETLHTR